MKINSSHIPKALVWMVLMLGLLIFIVGYIKKKAQNRPTAVLSSSNYNMLLEHQDVLLRLNELAVQVPGIRDYRNQFLKKHPVLNPGKVKSNDLASIRLLYNGLHKSPQHLTPAQKLMIQERLKKCR